MKYGVYVQRYGCTLSCDTMPLGVALDSRQIGPQTVGPRTVGPQTVRPQDNWALESWAPGPGCPGPNCMPPKNGKLGPRQWAPW